MIRGAKKEDANKIIDLLMVIFRDMELPFLQTYGEEKTREILLVAMDEQDYRYNYHRGIVCELGGEIAGVAFGYPSNEEPLIDEAFTSILPEHSINQEDTLFKESETLPEEWYLDSISVDKGYQGKGVGTELLKALPHFAKVAHQKKIGLNVDYSNPKAKKLYEKIGYEEVEDILISGHKYKHMQKDV